MVEKHTVNDNTNNKNKKSKKPTETKSINVSIITLISIIILMVLLLIIVMQYEKNNSFSRINDIDTSDNALDDINKEGNKIDWEEYPENIYQDMEEMRLSENNGMLLFDDHNDENSKIKTIWSYLKNGYKDESFIYQYSLGDSTEIIRHESNYPQYNDSSSNNTVYKYSDKIIYEIAVLHDDLYAFSNMEGKNEKEQEREQAKMESARNAKIAETVAYQWNNLKKFKKYNGQSNLNSKNYYYEINKMVIMNGYNYSEYWYKTNARAKKIKVTINSDKEYIFDLKDTNRAQEFNIDYKQNNVERPVSIEIEVLEKYNGNLTEDVFISDIQFGISSNIPQGR